MSQKFKIHTREVRRAAKKKNLTIKQQLTVNEDEGEFYSCPIGALYCEKKNVNLLDEDELYVADDVALEWGSKKYGKYYVSGFVEGFDYGMEYESFKDFLDYSNRVNNYLTLNSKQKKQWKSGFMNGRLLAKYLLEE